MLKYSKDGAKGNKNKWATEIKATTEATVASRDQEHFHFWRKNVISFASLSVDLKHNFELLQANWMAGIMGKYGNK